MKYTLEGLSPYTSILLIGIGQTNKYIKNIVRPESQKEMAETFGDCPLTAMYSMIVQMGCENVCVLNLEVKHDYLEVATMLRDYQFAYIVPLNIYLSDIFYDPLRNGKKSSYIQYLMERIFKYNDSTVVVTDKHASLYETIDDFLNDMDGKLSAFKRRKTENSNYKNVIFTANNIASIAYANAYLTAMMAITSVDNYPAYNNNVSLKTVFDIDTCDVSSDMCYFKKHMDGKITVENLLNLDDTKNPLKIEFLHRIQKFMFINMDYSDSIGQLYTEYQLKEIERKTISYLESYIGWILRSYSFKDIFAKESTTHPGTVDIYIKIDIQPIDCTEQFEVIKKIGSNR